MSKAILTAKVKVNNTPLSIIRSSGKFVVARDVNGALWYYGTYETEERANEVVEELGDGVILETAERTAHWEPSYGNVKCSCCGHTEESRNVGAATHFCSFCGARMEGEA